uniref:Ig-like domain-containing protein n=1 Tax=Piliocolobus tephrosceles TaxID=591936 RepID=A0A8C9GGG2_9PRIM
PFWPLLLNSPLLFYLVGSWAQSALTQPHSVSGSPGQLVTISCTGTSSDVGRYNCLLVPSAPRHMIYGVSKQPSGVSDCFSGSKSGNTASMTISGLQAEDEADYYCCSYAGSTTFHSGHKIDSQASSLANTYPPPTQERVEQATVQREPAGARPGPASKEAPNPNRFSSYSLEYSPTFCRLKWASQHDQAITGDGSVSMGHSPAACLALTPPPSPPWLSSAPKGPGSLLRTPGSAPVLATTALCSPEPLSLFWPQCYLL